MNKLKRCYLPFMKAGIQTLIAYRMNFLGFVIGGLIYCFVMFYLWKAVFESAGSGMFLGFSMTDMVLYLFLSNTTSQLTFSSVSTNIGEEIRDGSIVMFSPLHCVLYLCSVALAYMISFRVNLCFGFMAFYVKNLWGFNILKNSIISFLSGALIPLAFMPEPLRIALEYMPFASMGYTPVMIYMGKYGAAEIALRLGIQLVWAAALYGISKLIWAGAVKKLSVQGG